MRRTSRSRSESGFFTVWVLGLCVMVFFAGGLSLDLWKGFSQRRQLAQVADSAAIAGASQIDLDAFKGNSDTPVLDPAAAIDRANEYLDQAAVEDGLDYSDRQVVVSNDNRFIEVTLSETSTMTLTKILISGRQYTVTVKSSSEPREAA